MKNINNMFGKQLHTEQPSRVYSLETRFCCHQKNKRSKFKVNSMFRIL